MAVETDAQIKARIAEIREETAPSGNTAERIAAALENIYNTATQLDPSNFAPYDPDREYSNVAPDYVSYNDGTATNSYEYIYPTPSTGNVPTNTTYWRLVSAGQFNHIQNTDTHTTSRIYELGKLGGTLLDSFGDAIEEPTGSVVLVFGRANDNPRKTAIREFWETVEGEKEYYLQFCLDYTGTGSDVWVDLGPNNDYLIVPYYDEAKTYYAPVVVKYGNTLWQCNTDAGTTGPFDSNEWVPLSVSIFDFIIAPDSTYSSEKIEQIAGIAYKTGTVVDFVARETWFGSLAIPETGNYTADLTDAIVGHEFLSFHNSGTEPTFSTEYNRLPNSGDYTTGQINRIVGYYAGGTTIDYVIL